MTTYHHDHIVGVPCSDTCPAQAVHGTPEWERRMLLHEWPKHRHDEVYPGLWIGGAWRGNPHPGEFDVIVTLCGDLEASPPQRAPGRIHVNHPLHDREDGIPDRAELDQLVADVIAWVREGKRTLVRCYAGLNRSGLVVGLALCELTGHAGAAIIDAMRAQRSPIVLCNPAFAGLVDAVPSRRNTA